MATKRKRHPGGRPPMFGERMGAIIKGYVPLDLSARLRAECDRRQTTPSAALREAIEMWLGAK